MASRLILPAGWREPDQTVIMATTPRSGSTLLSGLLDSTGLLRRTAEYFNDREIQRWTGKARASIKEKLLTIEQQSRTDGNLISMKLFPPEMLTVLDHGLPDTAFRNIRFIYLQRQDVLGQALSLARALQTDQWNSVGFGPKVGAEYDETAIREAINRVVTHNAWWQSYLATQNVPLIRLTYEEVEAHPADAVASVVRFLGFDPAQYPVRLEKIALRKQRDETTEEWRRRFLARDHSPVHLWDGRPKARTVRNAALFLRKKL